LTYEQCGGTVRWQGSGSARWPPDIASKREKDVIYTERTQEYIANTGLSRFGAQKRTGL
jgi:hypothetical protein